LQKIHKRFLFQEKSSNDEIVLRGDKRYINCVTRASPGTKSITENESTTTLLSGSVYLTLHPHNQTLCLRRLTQSSSTSSSQGVVQISVKSFWIPDEIVPPLKKSPSSFMGYSGVVMAISGATSNKFEEGELVFGVTRTNRLGNILQVKENDVIKKPKEMDLQQAASLSSCLPLAYFALGQALSANKSKDCIVIIHEANKDLGLACLLVAKAMELSVICTTSDSHAEDSKLRLKELGAMLVTDAHLTGLYQW